MGIYSIMFENENDIKYFAYGSNMLLEKMKTLCPLAQDLGTASLFGYTVYYPIFSEHWQGRVIGIMRKNEGVVIGRLYSITVHDLEKLQDWEGDKKQEDQNYDTKIVTINRAGDVVKALTFFPEKTNECDSYINPEYLFTIVKGLIEIGASSNYIKNFLEKSIGFIK